MKYSYNLSMIKSYVDRKENAIEWRTKCKIKKIRVTPTTLYMLLRSAIYNGVCDQ